MHSPIRNFTYLDEFILLQVKWIAVSLFCGAIPVWVMVEVSTTYKIRKRDDTVTIYDLWVWFFQIRFDIKSYMFVYAVRKIISWSMI